MHFSLYIICDKKENVLSANLWKYALFLFHPPRQRTRILCRFHLFIAKNTQRH